MKNERKIIEVMIFEAEIVTSGQKKNRWEKVTRTLLNNEAFGELKLLLHFLLLHSKLKIDMKENTDKQDSSCYTTKYT